MSFPVGIGSLVLGQRGALMPWSPVMLALGIAAYFSLRFEPAQVALWGSGALAFALALVAWRAGPVLGPIAAAAALIAAGFALAGARAHLVAAPKLDFRYYGAIEGRIVGIDRSASGALRLTLDQVRLHRVRNTPKRVRISLHGRGGVTPLPGMRVMTTGHLSPPQGPVEPGGFDFRRHAWFLELGAIGYTRVPLMESDRPDGSHPIFDLRMRLSAAVQIALQGEVGAFGAAITTGDRSGMGEATLDALRRTNLAHLLAISGLHMGLVAGFIFGAVRLGLALVPYALLRLPARKIAASVALCGAAGYLALSGGNVATERAFVMAAVALVAVLFDRRAISLRAVAVAALIVLVLRPEALMGPGFQMSFAATTALVAVFSLLRDERLPDMPGWLKPVLMVALSSAVAGFATAPVAAAHFNRIAQFGLLANVLTVPVMGAVIVPSAVVAACLAPLGLENVALWIMGKGLAWVLGVAQEIASWEGVVREVVSPGPLVLPCLAFGGLFLALWRGRASALGVFPVACGFVLWSMSDRPDILVAEQGTLVGAMTKQGRALSRERGTGFVAEVWLENDGDGSDQFSAAQRWGTRAKGIASFEIADGATLWHISGKRALASFSGCAAGDIAVFDKVLQTPQRCTSFDPKSLRKTGSLAITNDGTIRTARQDAGTRLWSAQ